MVPTLPRYVWQPLVELRWNLESATDKYEISHRYFSSPSSRDQSDIISTMNSEAKSISWPALLISGGVAGVIGWVATFPLDVVKTRIQGSEWSPPSSSPVNSLHQLRVLAPDPPPNPFR